MSELDGGGMSVEKWLGLIGRKGRATGSRWIAQGLIKAENILGQNFISAKEIQRFWARAEAGEFAMEDRGIIKHQKNRRTDRAG